MCYLEECGIIILNNAHHCVLTNSLSDIFLHHTETELTQQSAGVVILCAFEVHHLKEVSRGQLQSATRFFTKNSEYKKTINKAEKAELLLPLARSFLREGIINIRDGADVSKLTRNDVMKEKTF